MGLRLVLDALGQEEPKLADIQRLAHGLEARHDEATQVLKPVLSPRLHFCVELATAKQRVAPRRHRLRAAGSLSEKLQPTTAAKCPSIPSFGFVEIMPRIVTPLVLGSSPALIKCPALEGRQSELDFWENVWVNLFSNLVWILTTFVVVQVARNLLATSQRSTSSAQGAAPPPVRPSLGELVRRTLHATFSLIGLLVALLLIGSTMADRKDPATQVIGWSAIVGTWCLWIWSMRDPRLKDQVLRGGGPKWLRASFAVVISAFWLCILAGLAYLVYAN
jgi:hypothetical protein